MKKKHRNKKKHGRRNAGPAGASPRRRLGRGEPPRVGDIVASLAGSAGGALVAGLAVSSKTLTEDEAGLFLTAVGGATAWFADGPARIVGNSVASVGTGQLAASYLHKRAEARFARELAKAEAEKLAAQAAAKAAADALPPRTQPALPPAPSPGLANAADGGGYMTELFRGAADELEMLDGDDERNAEFDVFHVEDFAA